MTTATATPTVIRPADAAAAGALPRKTFAVEFKDDGGDAGEFELYAAVFGNRDRDGDIIEPGAFDNLAEFSEDGWSALNHRGMDLPVGYIVEAAQDQKGLKVRGRFHSTDAAQACRTVVKERMAAKKRVLCSIGYVTRDESFERVDGQPTRRIKRLSVYEVSFVNLPANTQAAVTSVKGAETMPETKPPATRTKAGRAISKANHDKLRALADRLGEHHSELAEQIKCMKQKHKEMCAVKDEMDEFLKSFDAGESEGDDEDDGDGDEGKSARKPAAKSKSSPTPTPAPAPAPSRESIALQLAALKPLD